MKLQIPNQRRTTIHLATLPDGVNGIKATLALMVKLARASRMDYTIRNQALHLVQELGQKHYIGEVRSIQEFVRDRIRYVRDINGVETLATPVNTLKMAQGDCDDKSLLTAALLESIGHRTRFVAVGNSPGDYSHVLVETLVYMPGGVSRWIPVETTEPVPLGWYPPGMKSRLVYDV